MLWFQRFYLIVCAHFPPMPYKFAHLSVATGKMMAVRKDTDWTCINKLCIKLNKWNVSHIVLLVLGCRRNVAKSTNRKREKKDTVSAPSNTDLPTFNPICVVLSTPSQRVSDSFIKPIIRS